MKRDKVGETDRGSQTESETDRKRLIKSGTERGGQVK